MPFLPILFGICVFDLWLIFLPMARSFVPTVAWGSLPSARLFAFVLRGSNGPRLHNAPSYSRLSRQMGFKSHLSRVDLYFLLSSSVFPILSPFVTTFW